MDAFGKENINTASSANRSSLQNQYSSSDVLSAKLQSTTLCNSAADDIPDASVMIFPTNIRTVAPQSNPSGSQEGFSWMSNIVDTSKLWHDKNPNTQLAVSKLTAVSILPKFKSESQSKNVPQRHPVVRRNRPDLTTCAPPAHRRRPTSTALPSKLIRPSENTSAGPQSYARATASSLARATATRRSRAPQCTEAAMSAVSTVAISKQFRLADTTSVNLDKDSAFSCSKRTVVNKLHSTASNMNLDGRNKYSSRESMCDNSKMQTEEEYGPSSSAALRQTSRKDHISLMSNVMPREQSDYTNKQHQQNDITNASHATGSNLSRSVAERQSLRQERACNIDNISIQECGFGPISSGETAANTNQITSCVQSAALLPSVIEKSLPKVVEEVSQSSQNCSGKQIETSSIAHSSVENILQQSGGLRERIVNHSSGNYMTHHVVEHTRGGSSSVATEQPPGCYQFCAQKLPRQLPRQWQLRDFKLEKKLGSGRFGQVYKAHEKLTKYTVALKVLTKSELIEHGADGQLRREIEIQRELSHPNILRLFGFFHDHEHVYLILEYAPGGELKEVLRKCGDCLREPVAAQFIEEIAGALRYCHSKGVIHRDLKPENLLLDANQRIKIGDFGWSVHAVSSSRRSTVCGTLDFLAPELCAKLSYDRSVDVWALGVLMYEMLLGVPPFMDPDTAKTMERICSVDLHFPVEDDSTKISEDARDLIRSLLQKDPLKRMPLKDVLRHPWITKNVRP